MVELHGLKLGYGERVLVGCADTGFGRGTFTALIGRNGTGKSTLLRTLSALASPMDGYVTVSGRRIDSMSRREVASLISLVSTDEVKVADLTVENVVALGRAPYTGWFGSLTEADERMVAESLERVGMAAFHDKTLDSLSDGERQRVMISRALAQDTPLVLLDEPTAFLDLPNRYQIALLLRDLAHETGKTILYSSHDLSTALELCDTLWVMTPRGVVAGAPEDMLLSGMLEGMFEGTPLTLTPQGTVQLKRITRGTLRVAADVEPAVARMVERTATRFGYEVVEDERREADVLVGSSAVARCVLTRTDNRTTVEVPDFHALATLLRSFRVR